MTMAHNATVQPVGPPRRTFLEWMMYLFGVVATVVLGVPLVGYLLGDLRRRKPLVVDLGPLSNFPVEQTRYTTFENPLGVKWDGVTANNAVYVRYLGRDEKGEDKFWVFGV